MNSNGWSEICFNRMPDVSLSSILLLNTLSIKVEDCSVNLVGNVILGKKPVVTRLSKIC